MNIPLNRPELEKFVNEKVKSGDYSSPADVVEAGLARLMLDPFPDVLDEQDMVAIDESEKQIQRGQDMDWAEFRNRLRNKFQKK